MDEDRPDVIPICMFCVRCGNQFRNEGAYETAGGLCHWECLTEVEQNQVLTQG